MHLFEAERLNLLLHFPISLLLVLLFNCLNVSLAVFVVGIISQGLSEFLQGVLLVIEVFVGNSEVEVALRALSVQLDRKLVTFDGLFELTSSVIGVTQVVESRIVERVKADSLQVVLNGVLVVVLITVRITQVIETLNLLWIKFKRFLVIVDCVINLLDHVLSVGEVVEHI